MGCADCLWRDFTSVFVCDLAAADSTFCCCNALDNSGALWCSHSSNHNVLLPKRLESLSGYLMNQISVFHRKYYYITTNNKLWILTLNKLIVILSPLVELIVCFPVSWINSMVVLLYPDMFVVIFICVQYKESD